jgi:hypothetical protein
MDWDLADGPERADWCVLFRDATWVTLPEDDPYAESSRTWINGQCRDIAKRTVERVFERVFGYPLAIDPLTYHGPCFRKSNLNAVKDGVVVQCPIPAGDLDDQSVYERLIDSRVPGLGIVHLRPLLVGGTIVSVRRSLHPDWIRSGRLDKARLESAIVYPETVFSPEEQLRITAFCAAMRLDVGVLDVLRENADGRIYIIDANNTPGVNARDDPLAQHLVLRQLAQAWVPHFPSRRQRRARGPAGGTPGR